MLIFGERGVGKTSLANILATRLTARTAGMQVIAPRVNCDTGDDFSTVWRKVFSKVEHIHGRESAGFDRKETVETRYTLEQRLPDKVTTEDVRRELSELAAAGDNIVLTIIDEFDRLRTAKQRAMFSDLIKTLSDHDVRATVVLVGVADSVNALVEEHQSVSRALVQVQMPRMTQNELKEIVQKGLERLPMTMEEEGLSKIALLSQGLPFYVHLLALCSCQVALDEFSDHITADHLEKAIPSALTQIQQSLTSQYHKATASPRKESLYPQVLLACALSSTDEQGYFTAGQVRQPLSRIAGRDLEIPSFAKHLKVFSESDRGPVLQRFGQKHRLRFRFVDPLMQPYVIMKALASGKLSQTLFEEISGARGPR